MTPTGRGERTLRSAAWLAAVLPALLWVAVSGQIQPSLIVTATVIAASVVLGACAAAVTLVLTRAQPVLIPVRAQTRRTPARQRLWDADAPGRPRSRAPSGQPWRD